MDLSNIKTLLNSHKSIVITSHANPDGDAIGSSLAMYFYLLKKGHNVKMIVPNDFPDFLKWMDSTDEIMLYERNSKVCKKLINDAEIIFCLDYNAIPRLGDLADPVRKAGGIKINIDHHVDPVITDFDYLFSKVETSSTGELIYDFIESIEDEQLLDKTIAECLYTSIVTDTGSFSFNCNFENTYRIIGHLISLGIDGEQIHRYIYDTYSEDRLRLLGYCLSDKLVVLQKYATAYIYLSKEDLNRFNYQVGDTEGIVNYALSIKGINLAVFLTEREKKIRMSFRSKGNFSVNEFAKKYFAGGGHRNAAGGDSFDSMENTINKLLGLLEEYKEKLRAKG